MHKLIIHHYAKSIRILSLLALTAIAIGCMLEKSNSTLNYAFDVNDAKDYSFLDVFSDYDCVKLESNKDCYFGTIDGLEVVDGKFVVFTRSGSSPAILIFNESGEFIWKTIHGKGPNEFGLIWGFCVNREGKEVFIVESDKITVVDLNGSIKKIIKPEHPIQMPVGEHYFSNSRMICRSYNSTYFNIQLDGRVDSLNSLNYGFDGSVPYIKDFKGRTIVMYRFNNIIYSLDGNTLVPFITLDFKQHNLPKDAYLKYTGTDWHNYLYEDYRNSSKVFWFSNFACNNIGDMFFTASYKNNDLGFLYCNRKKKTYVMNSLKIGVEIELGHHPQIVDNLMFFPIQCVFAKQEIEQPNVVIDKRYSKLQNLINESGIDDNPIILIGKL